MPSVFEMTLVEEVLAPLHRSSLKDVAQLDLREDEKIIRINSSNLLDCQQQTFLHIELFDSKKRGRVVTKDGKLTEAVADRLDG